MVYSKFDGVLREGNALGALFLSMTRMMHRDFTPLYECLRECVPSLPQPNGSLGSVSWDREKGVISWYYDNASAIVNHEDCITTPVPVASLKDVTSLSSVLYRAIFARAIATWSVLHDKAVVYADSKGRSLLDPDKQIQYIAQGCSSYVMDQGCSSSIWREAPDWILMKRSDGSLLLTGLVNQRRPVIRKRRTNLLEMQAADAARDFCMHKYVMEKYEDAVVYLDDRSKLTDNDWWVSNGSAVAKPTGLLITKRRIYDSIR